MASTSIRSRAPAAARKMSAAVLGIVALAAMLLYFPNALRFVAGTTSNAIGVIVASALLILVALAKGRMGAGSLASRALGGAVILVALLSVHLFVAISWNIIPQDVDLQRTALSLVAVAFGVVAAGVIGDWLTRVPDAQLQSAATIIAGSLIVIGVFGYIGLQPPATVELTRPSFPFTEPSHLALVAAPFVIQQAVRLPLGMRYLWLGVWLALAFANQSLSLIVVIAIAAAASLPILWAAIAAVPVALLVAGIDTEYYTDRLDVSLQTENLSALVYRQGWELAESGFGYNSGLGIGFQQLGLAPLNVPTSDVIFRILRDDSNLRDGSFVLAKLVSEFGVFGLLGVIAFTLLAVKAVIMLRRMSALPGDRQDAAQRFALAVCCGFAVEMFVRGIGYFSATVILLLAAIFAWRRLFREPLVSWRAS